VSDALLAQNEATARAPTALMLLADNTILLEVVFQRNTKH
jgi:hypothetical protein